MRVAIALFVLVALAPAVSRADEQEPKKWEQLFFPFPIVGAPPQLEQQIQLFNSYFRGSSGSGDSVAVEAAAILSPHLGLVAYVPFQFGFDGQTTGFEDTTLQLQALATGSLRYDDMLSLGVTTTMPTGHADLTAGDLFAGLFAYGAKRFFHHLIFEGNVTLQMPTMKADTAKQLLGTGLVSLLLTPRHFDFPVYAQVELNSTTYFGGTGGLPAGATKGPVETLFIAPEVFLGPFKTPISEGTRVAAGVSFDVAGDPVHAQTYTVTVAFDIPNKYGY